jgi:phosphohistidine phosphatase
VLAAASQPSRLRRPTLIPPAPPKRTRTTEAHPTHPRATARPGPPGGGDARGRARAETYARTVDSDPRPERRLILLRHAKSDWPEGVADLDRPLGERGVVDAGAAGATLADLVQDGIAGPDPVLCSPARRTRQTWELVSTALPGAPAARFEPVIYGASVGELIELVRSVPSTAGTVLVIGHESTMSETTAALAAKGSATRDLARLREKFPTAAMAVLRPAGEWAELAPDGAALETFLIPRG